MPYFFAALFLLPAFGLASESSLLKALTLRPTASTLAAFTQQCDPDHFLDFSGGKTIEDSALKKARRAGNLFLLRGLVYAYGHCTDGASSESLRMALGNELLLKHSKTLLDALAAEHAGGMARDLARAENEQFFGVDCRDEKCQSAKARFHQRKVNTLRKARGKGEAEAIRASMLDAIEVVP